MVVDNTSNCDPFKILYGLNPLTPIDLLTMPNISVLKHKDTQPKVDYVRKQHKKVEDKLKKKVKVLLNKLTKEERKSSLILEMGYGYT